MKKFGRLTAFTLLYLVVFDLIGVAACFFLDVIPSRGSSAALMYAIWFVLGVFCGLLSYITGGGIMSGESKGDWMNREDAGRTSWLVIAATSAILAALAIPCYLTMWRRFDMESSYFVPASEGLTLTFFLTILAVMIFGHKTLLGEPTKKGLVK